MKHTTLFKKMTRKELIALRPYLAVQLKRFTEAENTIMSESVRREISDLDKAACRKNK